MARYTAVQSRIIRKSKMLRMDGRTDRPTRQGVESRISEAARCRVAYPRLKRKVDSEGKKVRNKKGKDAQGNQEGKTGKNGIGCEKFDRKEYIRGQNCCKRRDFEWRTEGNHGKIKKWKKVKANQWIRFREERNGERMDTCRVRGGGVVTKGNFVTPFP